MDKLFLIAGFVGCGLLTLALHKMCSSYARGGLAPSSASLPLSESDPDEDWDYELEEEGDDVKVVKPVKPVIFYDAKGNVYDAPKIVRGNIYGEQPFF